MEMGFLKGHHAVETDGLYSRTVETRGIRLVSDAPENYPPLVLVRVSSVCGSAAVV